MRCTQLKKEEAVLFGPARSLVGIVAEPLAMVRPHGLPAVLLLNPGIVHRVGPGRIYVKIARELAALGFVVLRFDFSGIGDSVARQDALPFEKSAVCETQDAMEYLQRTRGIDSFICLGGCSGALVSLQTACCDTRVVGGVLINFQMADAGDVELHPDLPIRRAAHYYWNFACFDRKSWYRLLTGRTDYRKLIRAFLYKSRRRLVSAKKPPREVTPLEADLQRLAQRRIHLSFLCSEGDPLLDDLRDAGGAGLEQLCASGMVALEVISRSDHTFSSLDDQQRLVQVVLEQVKAIGDKCGTPQITPDHAAALLPWPDRTSAGAATAGALMKGGKR